MSLQKRFLILLILIPFIVLIFSGVFFFYLQSNHILEEILVQ